MERTRIYVRNGALLSYRLYLDNDGEDAMANEEQDAIEEEEEGDDFVPAFRGPMRLYHGNGLWNVVNLKCLYFIYNDQPMMSLDSFL
jgi:hypothetical protein